MLFFLHKIRGQLEYICNLMRCKPLLSQQDFLLKKRVLRDKEQDAVGIRFIMLEFINVEWQKVQKVVDSQI